ncbi:FAD/FMN-containing dehydrogenase [Skeletonema marinoi]|uniref:FAD/FMN-containing dehydrogenase n=1 Tax=Skeletonema marinoi TaxID=267567 RepID=A0AAD8Y5D8_9STRA|nr:FAD/FMN-containing dehydrogenase [Skeletonema marinoi]
MLRRQVSAVAALLILTAAIIAGAILYTSHGTTTTTAEDNNTRHLLNTQTSQCATNFANTQCSLLDNRTTRCGGPECESFLECDIQTHRCVSKPRQYGEPCDKIRPCGDGLRCSKSCGICVYEMEEDILPVEEEEDDDEQTVVTACGISSTHVFRTWGRVVRSDHPVVMPTNDDELKSILLRAKEGGCKVRPSGSTHSAAGLVAEATSKSDVVVVSLDRYIPSDANWATPVLMNEGANTASVKVPAGFTQLELYSVIRPKRYFLPTQTAGFLFTIAGVVGSFVHGGSFGDGPIHNHVQAMRVMLWDGTIAVIDKEDELRYWRNSYGLLGIITAVELTVIKRSNFRFGTLPSQSLDAGWNAAGFDEYINGIRKEYTAAEFFMNPHTKEILAIVQKDLKDVAKPSLVDSDCVWSWFQCQPSSHCSYQYEFGDWSVHDSCRTSVRPPPTDDDECGWDYKAHTCRNSAYCSYQYKFGDLTLDESCRLIYPPPPSVSSMKDAYNQLINDNPLLGVTGVAVGNKRLEQDGICLASRIGLERVLLETIHATIPSLVREAYDRTNDGYLVPVSLPLRTPLLGYLIPADRLFAVLDKITKLNYVLSIPLEWRCVSFDNEKESAVLTPGDIKSGEWAAMEVVSNEIPGWTQDDSRSQFLQIETILKNAGGVPHTGKYFGMGLDDKGLIQPFMNVGPQDVFSERQKEQFRAYANRVDPEGLFWSGYMANTILKEMVW